MSVTEIKNQILSLPQQELQEMASFLEEVKSKLEKDSVTDLSFLRNMDYKSAYIKVKSMKGIDLQEAQKYLIELKDAEEVNSDILPSVAKRQAILDSFYDD